MEELDDDWKGPQINHVIAGACAGVSEHVGMFPLDTVKTHIQSGNVNTSSMRQTAKLIINQRGTLGLFRGMPAVAAGAAPAHGAYFASYEVFKDLFGGNKEGHHPIETGVAGMLATCIADGIMTPMDAVKQKMQLGARNYVNTLDCIRTVMKVDGIRGFYAGYTTTLVMNLPYNFLYFPAYETFKKLMHKSSFFPDDDSPAVHLLGGFGAGGFSGAVTNPLDVARTRLQTQMDGTDVQGYV